MRNSPTEKESERDTSQTGQAPGTKQTMRKRLDPADGLKTTTSTVGDMQEQATTGDIMNGGPHEERKVPDRHKDRHDRGNNSSRRDTEF